MTTNTVHRFRAAVAAGVAVLLGATACSSSPPTDTTSPAPTTPTQSAQPTQTATDAPTTDVPVAQGGVVFAAASLKAVFEQIATESNFTADFSFDGSSGLVDQLVGGAPADVFASADTKNMDRAVSEGVIEGDPVRFATNTLVLVTPAGNPGAITGLDASLEGKKLVICAAEVPCGNATIKLAEAVGITLKPVSEETKVTDVLGKVTSGEADAGLVYATDAAGAGDKVEAIEIPEAADIVNEYWIAAVKGGHVDAAKAFIDAVTSPAGAAALTQFGFGAA